MKSSNSKGKVCPNVSNAPEVKDGQAPNEHDEMLAEFQSMYQKNPASLSKYRKGYAILRLIRMIPDFDGFFSKKTLLPIVMMSFELKTILNVNIDDGTIEI